MNFFKKISYYLILPIISVSFLTIIFYYFLLDFEKSTKVTATLIQTLAIFIGGLWAYHKFGWDKKAETAIKIKALIMEYERIHNNHAFQYHDDLILGKSKMEAWTNYALNMMKIHNDMVNTMHLSCYLPKKVRKNIFDTNWILLNRKSHGENFENIISNWQKFAKDIEKIKEDLDEIVSK